jgi:hypothetical protein
MKISSAGMMTRPALLILLTVVIGNCRLARGQDENIIPLAKEPHHRLALHNSYVNVYEVTVAPHDIVALHRHDADAISVMLDDAEVTVRSPGKTDVHSKLSAGQIRMQPSGYIHSTTIDSEKPYRNITVELLQSQTGAKNRCASVLSGQPLNCTNPAQPVKDGAYRVQPQFETEQTRIEVYRIGAHGTVPVSAFGHPALVVPLNPGVRRISNDPAESEAESFFWTEKPEAGKAIRNDTEEEAKVVLFVFRPR